MKIEVNKKPAKAEPEYPCLKTSGSTVVLFSEGKIGTVVYSDIWKVGSCQEWNLSTFTPFNGSVTLSSD